MRWFPSSMSPTSSTLTWASALGLVALLAVRSGAEAGPPPADVGGAPALPAPRILAPRSAPERAKALAKFGGDAATEKAVEAGLDWLARHQEPDGRWDADGFPARCAAGGDPCDGIGKGQHGEDAPCPFDEAISAFAVLAFLGRGHVPGAEGDPWGKAVENELARLQAASDVWGVALAVQALSEAESMERKGRWLDAARSGAQRLLAAKQPDGAWAYAAGFRAGSDAPYTALVVQALAAARDVGVAWPDGLANGVAGFLDSLEAEEGKVAYLKDGRQWGYTPTSANGHSSAAVREWMEIGAGSPRHKAEISSIAREMPAWKISFQSIDVPGKGKVRAQIGNLSLYQWWYGTLAEFQAGGDGWSAWFARVKSALLPHQRTSGCARGSWDPEGTYERQTGGRVMSTALAVLMLEEPYRHLRLAK